MSVPSEPSVMEERCEVRVLGVMMSWILGDQIISSKNLEMKWFQTAR